MRLQGSTTAVNPSVLPLLWESLAEQCLLIPRSLNSDDVRAGAGPEIRNCFHLILAEIS